jgi:hypothetical protein
MENDIEVVVLDWIELGEYDWDWYVIRIWQHSRCNTQCFDVRRFVLQDILLHFRNG